MDLGLSGRRALVLGASRGLGAAVARGLAAEGAVVIAAARSRERMQEWISKLPCDARVEGVVADLGQRGQLTDLAGRLLVDGAIDILVNNGGGPPPGTAQDTTAEQWEHHFATMAANLFHLTRLLLPAMVAQGRGRIITVVSSGVEQPIPNLALSNGIRAAVVGWSKTLAAEVASRGVTVNVVLPGRIHTDRVDELDQAAAARSGKTPAEVAEASMASIPAGRYGSPNEFADVVTFLASARASYVTGGKIRVDGGMIRAV